MCMCVTDVDSPVGMLGESTEGSASAVPEMPLTLVGTKMSSSGSGVPVVEIRAKKETIVE